MNGHLKHPCGWRAEHAKKPICGPMAVATVGEVPLEVALAACKRNMLSHSKRFGGGTYPEQLSAAMTELGIEFEYAAAPYPMVLREFVDGCSSWGVTYVVHVTGHYVSIRDRYVIDQSQCCDISDHRSRRRRVQGFWRIISNKPIKLEIPA